MSDDLRTQKLKEQPHSNGKESVELFLYDEDSRQPHPTDSSIEVITMNLVGTVSLIGKPKVLEGDIVEVQYLYARKPHMMQQARLKCVRNDVQPEECTTAQLIYKREEAA